MKGFLFPANIAYAVESIFSEASVKIHIQPLITSDTWRLMGFLKLFNSFTIVGNNFLSSSHNSLDIKMHLGIGDSVPQEAIQYFMKRYY